MMLHRANTAAALPLQQQQQAAQLQRPAVRTNSPRMVKPDFRDGSLLEERDKAGRVLARYRCGPLLGRGGFAKCYEVTDIDRNEVLACKVIDRASLQKSKTLQKLHSEIAIHRRMKHKNIVNFLKTFQDDWYVYLILEKCSNQTLMEVAKTRRRFSTAETQFIMIQSISAIQYMHEHNVIHRDLKLGNMMLDADMNVKIGDFGLAAELAYDGERKRTICGTPNYIAPEILEGSRAGHSFEVDIWSLGVILYTLLVGEPPFQTNDVKVTYNRIKQCRYAFPAGLDISEHGKALVHRILQSQPDRRPTLMDIRSDPFFRDPVPPTSAPITMFPEGQQRRRREREAATATGAGVGAAAIGGAYAHQMQLQQEMALAAQLQAQRIGGTNANGREALMQLWGNGNAAPSAAAAAAATGAYGAAPISSRPPSPRDQVLPPQQPLASARGVRTDYGGALPTTTTTATSAATAAALPTRTRTSSAHGAGLRTASGADGPTVGGWCGAPVSSRPPSPRGVAPASVATAAAAASLPASQAPAASSNAAAATGPGRAVEDDDERNHLTLIHDQLHQTFNGAARGGLAVDPNEPALQPPAVWVTDYADFSAKYGLAYRLSTNHTGVHFNDSTKMCWEPITNRVEYYARVKETINGVVHAQDSRSSFHMDSFPETLNKKVTLIKYFKSYLTRDRSRRQRDGVEVVQCSPYVQPSQALLTEPNMVKDMVYVKRWLQTRDAMIFRLSNKCIQVCFNDCYEVILSSESKVVTYTDKSGRRRTIPLAAASQQDDEVAARLKFTKEILSRLINNREL